MTPLVWCEASGFHQYQNLTGTPLRYPVVVRCHGDTVVLDLQNWLHHALQQFTDGVDIAVGQFKVLLLGPSGLDISFRSTPHLRNNRE